MMIPARMLVFTMFLFVSQAATAKETLFEMLVDDAPKMKKMVTVCLSMLEHGLATNANITKTCSKSALTAMSYSTLVGAFGTLSEQEADSMIGIYVSKHGMAGLKNAQDQINEGATLAKRMLDVYYIMLEK